MGLEARGDQLEALARLAKKAAPKDRKRQAAIIIEVTREAPGAAQA